MGVKSFQIVFENNKQVFVSGEFINGHILIDFSEPQKARSKLKIINHIFVLLGADCLDCCVWLQR